MVILIATVKENSFDLFSVTSQVYIFTKSSNWHKIINSLSF